MGKKPYILLILCLVLISSSYAQTADPIISKLFRDSYRTIKLMRKANGIYLDALTINANDKPGSIAANGVGLISLCVADSMYKKTKDAINWESNSASLVNTTLLTFINFKNKGASNSKGLFRRYFDVNTGFEYEQWGTEYSTIDNAIFAMGLVFCKNYFFKDTSIVNRANMLLDAMDFTSAISSSGQQLFRVLDQNGNGSLITGAFNEYMLVAWLAKNVCPSNPGYTKSETYWNTYYNNALTSPVTRRNYWGYELISDGGWFISDFIPQFTYYYCHYFKNNVSYMTYFNNFRISDSLFWTKKSPGINSYEWGLGAGDNPGGGYSANSIDNNNLEIVSPQIIAGFIPVYSQAKSDLKALYNNGKGVSVYSLPDDTSRKVLWRYSRINTALRCAFIQAVDISTMLYGLATLPEYLGQNFFDKYNVYQSDPSITSTTEGSRCGTGTVTLGATASAGAINWYEAPTGGKSLGTGMSFTTPGLSSTTVYYVDATNKNCTTASRTAVTANITCTHINSMTSSDLIKVYPTLTNGIIEISIDESVENIYQIELFNNQGSLIQKIAVNRNEKAIQFDLTGFPAGLYLLIFDSKNGVFHYKIIKE
jgi:hypothetical protein